MSVGTKRKMSDEIANQATVSQSHKGSQIKSYTLKVKLDAVKYAELNGNREAARKFNVDVRRICDSKKNKDALTGLSLKPKGKERKTLEGAWRN